MARAHVDYRLPKSIEGTILERIVKDKLHEILGAMLEWPAGPISMALDRAPAIRSLKRSLMRHSPAIIAEIKKASPSAGNLRENLDPSAIGKEYQKAGAAAISIVTERRHFKGCLETIPTLRWACEIPLLRKDFIVDLYQVYETRHAGADALLLIASLHDTATLKHLIDKTEDLGMEALVEVHDESELERALAAGATLIGVNNRDLGTLEVSLDVSFRLAPRIPKEVVAVSESGIRSFGDIHRLGEAGYRGFLVGETLMRAASPGAALLELLSAPAGRKAS